MTLLRALRVTLFASAMLMTSIAWSQAAPDAPNTASPTALRDCRDCPAMLVLPAGRFMMGSGAAEQMRFGVTPDYAKTERPVHAVRIDRPFAIGVFPVTRDEWARYVADVGAIDSRPEGCAVFEPKTGVWAFDPNRSWRDPGFAQGGTEPVVCVGWAEARAYADWLSRRTGQHYRLPTEAEWEYAARAGTTTANYWGDDQREACRYTNASDLTRAEQHPLAQSVPDSSFPCHDGYVFTAPVAAFPPNPFGLYGMSGNVWQWVEDCFTASYDDARGDAAARLDGDCHYHMDRGASWVNSPRFVRAGARHKDLFDVRTSVLGFRLARDVAP